MDNSIGWVIHKINSGSLIEAPINQADAVNLLFLVPGVFYGTYLFSTSGNPGLLFMSGFTFLVWLVISGQRKVDLKQKVTFYQDRVFIGDRRLAPSPLLWSTETKNLVFENCFALPEPMILPAGLLSKAAIGWDPQGLEVKFAPNLNVPHSIVIGPTGSGKTELMKLMVKAFSSEVWAIDFKGGLGFRGNPNVTRLLTDLDSLDELAVMIDLFSARSKSPNLPPVLLVVDELGEVLKSTKHAQFVESVAAKGRSLGVFLVCANQTLSMVPRTIWVNCGHRFVLGADPIDRTLLGFSVKTETRAPGFGTADYLADASLRQLVFPLGNCKEKAASEESETANPLLSRVDPRLRSEPFAGFVQAR